jgi:hypothetical protein
MSYRVRLLLAVGIFWGSFALLWPAQSLAAGQSISLTTSPVSLDLIIKPGTDTTKTLQLMNNGNQPLPIKVQLDEFGAHGSSGEAAITVPAANDPAPSWVHFSPAEFTAQPGVWNSVQMTMNIPRSASLGYYYAVVFQPQLSVTPTAPHSSIIKGSNAILILVDTQSGNERRQVEIGNFTVSKHLYEYLPAKFTVTVQNSGNIYLAPTGNIFISRNKNGTNTIATLDVNSAGGNVLPNSSRTFQASWADGFPAFQPKTVAGQPVLNKKGVAVEQLQWNFAKVNKFRFGKYYAQLTLVYNNGSYQVPLNAVISFWVIPWKLMIVALLIIILFVYSFWAIGRGLLRRIRGIKRVPRVPRRIRRR